MSILNPDVLDEILRFFDRNDLAQFRTLERTSRCFLLASRRRSISTHHVRANTDASINRIVDILSSNFESISPHVNTIVIGRVREARHAPLRLQVSLIVQRCTNIIKLDLQDVTVAFTFLSTLHSVISVRLARVEIVPSANIIDVLRYFPNASDLTLIRLRSLPRSPDLPAYTPYLASVKLEFIEEDVNRDSSFVLVSHLVERPDQLSKLRRLNIFSISQATSKIVSDLLTLARRRLMYIAMFVALDDRHADEDLKDHGTFQSCNSWFRDSSGRDHFHFEEQEMISA